MYVNDNLVGIFHGNFTDESWSQPTSIVLCRWTTLTFELLCRMNECIADDLRVYRDHHKNDTSTNCLTGYAILFVRQILLVLWAVDKSIVRFFPSIPHRSESATLRRNWLEIWENRKKKRRIYFVVILIFIRLYRPSSSPGSASDKYKIPACTWSRRVISVVRSS